MRVDKVLASGTTIGSQKIIRQSKHQHQLNHLLDYPTDIIGIYYNDISKC
jgi:hypothetical protein